MCSRPASNQNNSERIKALLSEVGTLFLQFLAEKCCRRKDNCSQLVSSESGSAVTGFCVKRLLYPARFPKYWSICKTHDAQTNFLL